MTPAETRCDILLITPPLTQINTPYPATTAIKGFLASHGYRSFQADLGLELILDLFTRENLVHLFDQIRSNSRPSQPALQRTLALEQDYLKTVGPVIRFLQDSDPTLAYRISCEGFLPEGPRFETIEDMDWAFGSLGIQDRAKYMATQYLEDLSDLVRLSLSEDFGFSRYGERLALSATHFEPLERALQAEANLIDRLILKHLKNHIETVQPRAIGFSIPFPGCLYAALKCGRFIKEHYPHIAVLMGGGYVNTELRNLETPRFFEYTDYLSLDDGEMPSLQILRYIDGEIDRSRLVRTYCLVNGAISYTDCPEVPSLGFEQVGAPDYSDLLLDRYLSIVEIANPMHRIWSDGRWNKMALAHGCYWKKCAFCDISLDYIGRFDPATAKSLVDRIESIIGQTGQTGFHFVDEAAPPELLKELAIEILSRGLTISWWTNIRFENRFSKDLCRLLAASGCIGVSGGLETASDRLLKLICKGITIAQAARVANNLQNAGILVHTYLIYGFPTQTEQETIDALEIVRQFFLNGLIQSAFWHRFALTVHSQVGRSPEDFGIVITGPPVGDFAQNDLLYEDPTGADHDRFATGLNKAIYNYMYGVGLDFHVSDWFEFKVPAPACSPDAVQNSLLKTGKPESGRKQILWIGSLPEMVPLKQKKKEKKPGKCNLFFNTRTTSQQVTTSEANGRWLISELNALAPNELTRTTLDEWKQRYEGSVGGDFKGFMQSRLWSVLTSNGLLLL